MAACLLISYDTAMQLIRNPQLWLALARELGQRNRHLLLNQVAGSLAFTTTLALVPMFTVGSILIGYVPQVIEMKYALQEWVLNTYLPGGINQLLPSQKYFIGAAILPKRVGEPIAKPMHSSKSRYSA